jgi:arylformamidase
MKGERGSFLMKYDTIYDISVLLGEESIDYPGDTPYSRELIWTIEDSGTYDLSKLVMSAHSGTHIDAPAHFVPDGKTIDQYPANDFILPAEVVEIQDTESIRPAELRDLDIAGVEAILFKTDNSMSGRCRSGSFMERFVYLSLEAADFCVQKGTRLVGIDYITIEKYGDQSFAAHRTLMGQGILILEGIDLRKVPAGRYTLLCLPLRMKNGEASPVRAILLR